MTRVVLFFLLMCTREATCQSPLWALGNQSVAFQETASQLQVSALPTPAVIAGYNASLFYNGAAPLYCQGAAFDEDGQLRLFVIDGRVYNKQGYLILDSYFTANNATLPIVGRHPDIIITTLPGSCSKYLIISSGTASVSDATAMSYSIIDLNKNNPFFPDLNIKGAPISTQTQSLSDEGLEGWGAENQWIVDHVLSGGGSLYANRLDPFGGMGKEGAMHFDIMEKSGNNEKYLFAACQQSVVAIRLTAQGFDSSTVIPFNVGDGTRSEVGEIECAIDESTGNYLLAVTGSEFGATPDYAQVKLYSLNPSFLNLNWSEDLNINPSTTPTGQTNLGNTIYGLEFSPNGRSLYFCQEQYPKVGYINVIEGASSVELLPFSLSIFENNYGRTRIGKNIKPGSNEQVVYFIGNSGLGFISNCDDPANSIWNSDIGTNTTLTTLPSFHNAFATQPSESPLFKTLPVQGFNSEQIIGFLNEAGCCNELSAGISFGSHIVNAQTTTWTPNQNPFGNLEEVVIEGDLIFEPGAKVTIQGMTFRFGPNSNVIINAGAAVRMKGSTFTSLKCENVMWQGVNLLGTSNQPQPNYPESFNGPGAQGVLQMFNNSEISNAYIGVEVGTHGPSSSMNTGGVLGCSNSTFENNQTDVYFRKYRYVT
ncbi:MAG: hypothetical protein RL092_540 [Bacteroidota bacterium]